MAVAGQNAKVDAYIEKAQPFAQPILEHLRELMHKGCPDVEEAIKWSMPFFVYKGAILANMAAFKQHCSFGFWGKEIAEVLREAGVAHEDGMGTLGRITSKKDLPGDKQMLGWIRQAASLVEDGTYTSPMAARNKVVKAPKAAPEASPEFAAALKKNKAAMKAFEAFSPSCKREYVEWIAEGKQRNWKYQNC